MDWMYEAVTTLTSPFMKLEFTKSDLLKISFKMLWFSTNRFIP